MKKLKVDLHSPTSDAVKNDILKKTGVNENAAVITRDANGKVIRVEVNLPDTASDNARAAIEANPGIAAIAQETNPDIVYTWIPSDGLFADLPEWTELDNDNVTETVVDDGLEIIIDEADENGWSQMNYGYSLAGFNAPEGSFTEVNIHFIFKEVPAAQSDNSEHNFACVVDTLTDIESGEHANKRVFLQEWAKPNEDPVSWGKLHYSGGVNYRQETVWIDGEATHILKIRHNGVNLAEGGLDDVVVTKDQEMNGRGIIENSAITFKYHMQGALGGLVLKKIEVLNTDE